MRNEKPPGNIVRTPRRSLVEASAEVASKRRAGQIGRASAEPSAEGFLDELLAPIATEDLKEVHQLEIFFPLVVLVPRPATADQVALRKMSFVKLVTPRPETKEWLGVLAKAVKGFKNVGVSSSVAFGDVSINFSAMEAARMGEPVVLTTLEFKTLRYFVQNARRVISSDELLNEVWGYENYPCTRTVDNHILKLRQKLERDPSRPLHFRTMRGAGYKFMPL
jgi:DNA-binding response OmpR family regulator